MNKMENQQIEKTKLLIFGGSGFIGQNLQEVCNQFGIEYRVIDKRDQDRPIDILDKTKSIIPDIEWADIIVNLAAISSLVMVQVLVSPTNRETEPSAAQSPPHAEAA